MLKDRLRSILMGGDAILATPPSKSGKPGPRKSGAVAPISRHSHGLEQFCTSLRDRQGLNILDMSGASQANITFITELGHRIYSEDLIKGLDDAFGQGDFYQNQTDPGKIESFLEQNLTFPPDHFDGALVWDSLQYLAPPLLENVVDRLAAMLKRGSYILAFFHADEKAAALPLCYYRITDSKNLLLVPRGERRPAQFFNNRGLEKLFQKFDSVKFFLTRDHLREIIVKR